MSRILRRPMFRGGRVNSRGTGITTGLDRPGMQGGGLPPTSTFNINMGGGQPPKPQFRTYSSPIGPTQSDFRSGLGQGSRFFQNIPNTIKNFFSTGSGMIPRNIGRLFGGIRSLAGPAAILTIADQQRQLISQNTPRTVEALEYMKSMNDSGVFDETAGPGDYEAFKAEFDRLNTVGTPLEGSGVGLTTSKEDLATLVDKIRINKEKEINNQNNNDDRDGTGGAGNKETTTDIKDAIREDKELFAELLGAKKARGQDISDMLLSFSSKALAPEADVKSAFAEFAADEVKRPSRVQKVDDNAAALAINAYIAGEKSKADLDRALKSAEGRLNLEQNILKGRSLTSRINQDRTTRTELQKTIGNTKEWMSDNNIKGTPNLVKTDDIENPELLIQENVGEVFIDEKTKKVYRVEVDATGKIFLRDYH